MWLSNKLTPPSRPARPVARPRLQAQLDRWQSCRLVLVRAPAGYGKTSLVSIWAAGLPPAAGDLPAYGWLSLDGGDSDPVRFVRYLAAATDRLVPGVLAAVEATLMTLQPDAQQAMAALLRALEPDSAIMSAQPDPARPLLLVLDDYHRVNSPEVDALLDLALERAPAQLHFILLTRNLPRLPLARLFVTGELLELAADDLLLDPVEAEVFLQTIDIPPLSKAQLQQIMEQTHGWIAGLKMAGLSLADRTDPQRFIEQLRGTSRWQSVFLTGEVLAQQTPDMRRFLMATSILDRFSGELSAAVVGQTNAPQLLGEAFEAGLFISALDGQQTWFRYHHLFQELLQRRLQETHTATEISDLHRRAAAWLESHTLYEEAVEHYLMAGEKALAYPLIDHIVRESIRQLDAYDAERWLGRLRVDELDRYPRLLLALCRLNTLREDFDLAGNTARAARAVAAMGADDPLRPTAEAELSVYQAAVAFYQRDLAGLSAAIDRAHQLQPVLDEFGQATIGLLLVTQAMFNSAWAEARDYGAPTIISYERAGFAPGVIATRREMAAVMLYTGRGKEAARELERIWASYPNPQPSLVLSELFSVCVLAAEAYYWLNELDRCRTQAQRAAAIGERLDNVVLSRWAAQFLDQVDAAGMTPDQAAAATFRAQAPSRFLTEHFNIEWEVQYRVLTGRIDEALLLARLLEVAPTVDVTTVTPARILSHVLAHVAAAADLQLLDSLIGAALDRFEQTGSLMFLGRLQALEVWRRLQLHDTAAAETMLAAALETAARTGYTRPILNIPALGALLPAINHPLARQLKAQLVDVQAELTVLRESLTPRERRVLMLLSHDYRYKDIAADMGISFNTVRVYVAAIYRKLGVSRRIAAIDLARQMGQLEGWTDSDPASESEAG